MHSKLRYPVLSILLALITAVMTVPLAQSAFAQNRDVDIESRVFPPSEVIARASDDDNAIVSRVDQGSYSKRVFGKRLLLDGSGDYVAVPDASFLNFGSSTDFTIELWFNRQKDAEVNLVNKFGASGAGWKLNLGYYDSNPFCPCPISCLLDPFCTCPVCPPRMYAEAVQVVHGNRTYTLIDDRIPFWSQNTWYHLAVTVDRSRNETKVYADSPTTAYRNKMDDHPTAGIDLSSAGQELAIGGLPIGGSNWYKGEIDEVRVWNTVRTESQILATMLDTLSSAYYSTPDSGLVLYYRFDKLEDLGVGGEGKDVRDLCALGAHGALMKDAVIVNVEDVELPVNVALQQNYPNPFSSSTTIRFSLHRAAAVSLCVFDVLGKRVLEMDKGINPPGTHDIRFSGAGLPAGMYFYRLQTGGHTETGKMLLVR